LPTTKIQQFAAEAAALDVGDIRDILYRPRRYSLLLCFLHHAQVQTRDQLVEMLLKRMRHTTNAAKSGSKNCTSNIGSWKSRCWPSSLQSRPHDSHPGDEEAALGHSVASC